jgi:hypothetical protein
MAMRTIDQLADRSVLEIFLVMHFISGEKWGCVSCNPNLILKKTKIRLSDELILLSKAVPIKHIVINRLPRLKSSRGDKENLAIF